MPRTRIDKLALFTFLVVFMVSSHLSAQAPPDLVMEVSTDKDVYFLGEQVIISVESCNVGSEPAEWLYLEGGCPLFNELVILDDQGGTAADLQPGCHGCNPGGSATTTIWAPGECKHEDTIVWEQLATIGVYCERGAAVPSGTYTAEVRFAFPQRSDTASFEIGGVAEQVPISRWAAGVLAMAIASVGVRFLVRR